MRSNSFVGGIALSLATFGVANCIGGLARVACVWRRNYRLQGIAN